MKKFMKWYIKASIKTYVIYAAVAFIGDWIIKKYPLKNEEHQAYAELMFTMMKYCMMSPYYTLKWIFGKKNEEVAE